MKRKVLFVVNNAAFFCSHRLPLALAARDRSWEVALLTGRAGSKTLEEKAIEVLNNTNIPHYRTTFSSTRLSPFAEIFGFLGIIYRMVFWRPHIIHCASPKGVLYGGIASRLTRRPAVVLAISGMGSLFVGEDRGLKRVLRKTYLKLFQFALGHTNCRIIVQNHDDKELVTMLLRGRSDDIVLVPGSGVDLEVFAGREWSEREDRVLFSGRLLADKGIREFVEAARIVKQSGCAWRFVVAGTADYENPSMISKSELDGWIGQGWIEWIGHCADIAGELAKTRIVCLPSYREGMPKALLEAAASGCAVVTTDVAGCREAVLNGISGDLVRPQDGQALADALARLIDDPQRQRSYGMAGRRLAEERFGLAAVVSAILEMYDEIWSSVGGRRFRQSLLLPVSVKNKF